MSTTKIQATKNYALFLRHNENRPLEPKKHGALLRSMQRYGFLRCFPIVCVRDAQNRLEIKDGQHRYDFATKLGLTVYWVEADSDFDVAIVNSTPKGWVVADYARKYADMGLEDYKTAVTFQAKHKLPWGATFALLAGTVSYGNCQDAVVTGEFKVTDLDWADRVAGLYGPLASIVPATKGARLLEACMAVCRVPRFDSQRLLSSARRHSNLLAPCSTRDAYLTCLETLYNHGRRDLIGLRIEAEKAMRARNIVRKKESTEAVEPAA